MKRYVLRDWLRGIGTILALASAAIFTTLIVVVIVWGVASQLGEVALWIVGLAIAGALGYCLENGPKGLRVAITVLFLVPFALGILAAVAGALFYIVRAFVT
ncbi:MAG: hypothetical protein AB7I59_27185 [Geminicoccaceae bacterium]|uniref:hypothetical protein n=1 Tax=Reyranella sp. TaxID=1929291 RepID=UPI003D0F20E8